MAGGHIRSRAVSAQPIKLLLLGMLLSAVAGAWSSSPASAQPFNQVIVFGDSNVDSGYYEALTNPGGNATYNADWPTAVAHGAGAPTTSPGPMKSQVLAAFFGLTANPSNTTGGTNYATSGAKNVTVNNAQTGGFTAAIPTVTQISNYLSANGGSANGQALYFVYSGDNDASYAAGETGTGPYPSNPDAYMTQAADQLAAAVQSLYNAGAQHIIVSGLEYDFPKSDSTLMALKLLYTEELWDQLTSLGVPFLKGDVDTVRLAIAANPAQYGFTTISNATGNTACTQPSGISTAWALLCSSDPAAPSTWVSATAPQTNLFADDQHLATAGQRLFANYLFRLVVPATVTHDYNTNGKSDILWHDTSGDVALWEMSGAEVANSAGVGNAPANVWSIVGQRDFNDDGKSDILWQDTAGGVAIWFMNGPSVSSSAGVGSASGWTVAGTGDFNGDGYGDILWRDGSGNVAIWLMNGSSVIKSCGVGNAATTWQIAGTGDFDGNGATDILWHDTSGNVAIWFMSGCTIAQSAGVGNASPSVWSIAGTGDFNGDGKSDILWHDISGNVAVWEMNGAAIAASAGVGNANSSVWSIAQTGDFNGDGKSDILWHDTSGNVAVWEMNGASILQSAGVGSAPLVWSIQGAGAD
jgi:phospholipase/lecithinase/hemolysin